MVASSPLTDLRCPRDACRRVLGQTDGPTLYLGTCLVTRKVTLHCTAPNCDGRRTWWPAGA